MSHVHTLDLHRFRLGELDADRAEQIRSHLDHCERCAQRLAVQQNEREAFVAQPTPEVLKRAIRPPAANRTAPMWRLGLVAVAAAAMFAVVATNLDSSGALDEDLVQTRTKGELPDLELWLQSEAGPRAMRAGESLSSGDTVQLLFSDSTAPAVVRDPSIVGALYVIMPMRV